MTACQRWTERRHSWRHTSEGGFDRTRYEVATIDEQSARAYVLRHHYSGSYPAALHRFGIFERGELQGVAVLSVPVRAAVLTGVFPDLEPYAESAELGRLVLADAVPANAESWMLARCWELAAQAGIRGIVSFSDPMPRRTVEGAIVLPGHVGTVYQSKNAAYLGRGRGRFLTLLPDATVLNDRAIAKVKTQTKGHEYVERRLVAMGAPGLTGDPSAWLTVALVAIGARRVRHQGNHRYAFCLGGPAERRRLARAIPIERQEYPKAVDEAA